MYLPYVHLSSPPAVIDIGQILRYHPHFNFLYSSVFAFIGTLYLYVLDLLGELAHGGTRNCICGLGHYRSCLIRDQRWHLRRTHSRCAKWLSREEQALDILKIGFRMTRSQDLV